MGEPRTSSETFDLAPYYDRFAPPLGFSEYWYPACLAKEIGEKPLALTILGSPIALMRRNGKIHAIANECPHRGTPLSLGRCEFPGTNTISCAYHGWTFDVTNGNCVAALTDGPGSAVVNKVRVRTYPITECQGIVWIWMGKQKPVAPEEDIPAYLRKATVVLVVRRRAYGNWRWHIENPGMGHAMMLHRTSLYIRFRLFPGFVKQVSPVIEEQGQDGVWLCEGRGAVGMIGDYPDLGRWPRARRGAGIIKSGLIKDRMDPLMGISAKVSLRLPGTTRVTHFPIDEALYYEWFVQIDAEHYNYFQICCGFPRSRVERAWFLARYYGWGRPVGMIRFNSQDLQMVGASQDFAQRKGGWNPPTRLFRPDLLQIAWRDYAVRNARGVDRSILAAAKAEPTSWAAAGR
jgi:nitrite reductase/ring-hydroxylating ferredoxin subunit